MASQNQDIANTEYCDGCVDKSLVAQYIHNFAPGNAAKKGCLDCVNTAIDAGASVNAIVGPTGSTALLEAAKEGHYNCVAALAEAGADVNKEDNEQRTALFYAASVGIANGLKVLIQKGADVNKHDRNKCTPLILAAFNGHKEVISLLIRAGADINSCDSSNRTALVYSIIEEYIDCSEVLIEAGADVKVTLPYTGYDSVLMLAVQSDLNTIVNLLLKAGAGVNSRNRSGETALINAIAQENTCCLNLLIQAGADVNMLYQNDETALMLALIGGHSQCVAPLIEAGADVNGKSRTGESALSYALMGRNGDCIRVMIEAGADGHGSMLLHKLVASQSVGDFMDCTTDSKIKTLLRAGAMVNNTVDNLVTLCVKSQMRYARKLIVASLLVAAGEDFLTADCNTIFPNYPLERNILNLKDLCSDTIRDHLLELDPRVNLFIRVPKLGLPASITRFMLHKESVAE